MGKNDLAGKGLWESYSNIVKTRMNSPKFAGEITEKEAKEKGLKLIHVEHGAESCGDAVELYWLIDNNEVIVESKFRSFGCGTAIASSDVMAELCIGKRVDEAIRITNIDVERAMRDNPETPAVPGQKMHCSVMAYDVIKKAAASFKGVDVKEMEEKDIVCECARVTKTSVEDAIRINDLTTIEEIINYTKAGGYCGSCIEPGGHETRDIYLVDILKETRSKMKLAQNAKPLSDKAFKDLTIPLKLRRLNKALEDFVKPSLAADGGDVEILDIDGDTVFVEYSGACKGCAGASSGTLSFIQSTLTDKMGTEIEVKLYTE